MEENKKQEVTVQEEKKKVEFGSRAKKVIRYAIALAVFLVLTNPSLLFFLPESARDSLRNTWGQAFGNVDSIKDAVSINFIAIFKIVAIILLLLLLVNLIKLIIEKIEPKTGKARSVLSMINSFSSYAAVLLGIIMCLSALGVNMSTIFASIGVVALIVGFAAESLIADIITGVFLVFEDEFNVGDIVEINGFRGTIQSIGVRTTYIRDMGGNIKIVNNSGIRDVLNRSRTASKAVCDAPVPYGADLAEAEKVLEKILDTIPEKYPDVFKTRPKYIGVQELAGSSVNLRVVAEVDESNIFSAPRMLNREIKIGFDKAGIEIPFQQVVVHQARE